MRRLHDTDRSGWFILLGLIPLIGAIILLVWYCQRGSDGYNRFGAPRLPTAGARYAPPAQFQTGPAQAYPVNPAGATGQSSILQRLEQLGRLRDQGVLSAEEFAIQKAAILRNG